jgi:hypothetical protein
MPEGVSNNDIAHAGSREQLALYLRIARLSLE